MIIVEGPDGSGKTTICNIISNMTGYPIIHSPGPGPIDAITERMYWCKELLKVKELIADRLGIFSEYIYGTILRKSSYVSLKDLVDFLCSLNIRSECNLIIFSKQEFNHVKKDTGALFIKNGSEKMEFENQVDSKISEIKKLYNETFDRLFNSYSGFDRMVIRGTSDYPQMIKKIKEYCK